MTIINIDFPCWRDIIQSITALIAIPVSLFTLYKLVIKDKKRESEIKSLSTIASQLTGMQIETEKRFKSSKKPQIKFELSSDYKTNKINIKLTNMNLNSSIIGFKLTNSKVDFTDFTATSSTINTQGGEQSFFISLSGKSDRIESALLKLKYEIEEGYIFVQDLEILFDRGKYHFSPSKLTDPVRACL